MDYLKRSVIRKVVFASVISIMVSMAILTWLIVNNTVNTIKDVNEKAIYEEISLLKENIATFNKIAKSGADRLGDIFIDMLGEVKVDKHQMIKVEELSTPTITTNKEVLNLNYSTFAHKT